MEGPRKPASCMLEACSDGESTGDGPDVVVAALPWWALRDTGSQKRRVYETWKPSGGSRKSNKRQRITSHAAMQPNTALKVGKPNAPAMGASPANDAHTQNNVQDANIQARTGNIDAPADKGSKGADGSVLACSAIEADIAEVAATESICSKKRRSSGRGGGRRRGKSIATEGTEDADSSGVAKIASIDVPSSKSEMGAEKTDPIDGGDANAPTICTESPPAASAQGHAQADATIQAGTTNTDAPADKGNKGVETPVPACKADIAEVAGTEVVGAEGASSKKRRSNGRGSGRGGKYIATEGSKDADGPGITKIDNIEAPTAKKRRASGRGRGRGRQESITTPGSAAGDVSVYVEARGREQITSSDRTAIEAAEIFTASNAEGCALGENASKSKRRSAVGRTTRKISAADEVAEKDPCLAETATSATECATANAVGVSVECETPNKTKKQSTVGRGGARKGNDKTVSGEDSAADQVVASSEAKGRKKVTGTAAEGVAASIAGASVESEIPNKTKKRSTVGRGSARKGIVRTVSGECSAVEAAKSGAEGVAASTAGVSVESVTPNSTKKRSSVGRGSAQRGSDKIVAGVKMAVDEVVTSAEAGGNDAGTGTGETATGVAEDVAASTTNGCAEGENASKAKGPSIADRGDEKTVEAEGVGDHEKNNVGNGNESIAAASGNSADDVMVLAPNTNNGDNVRSMLEGVASTISKDSTEHNRNDVVSVRSTGDAAFDEGVQALPRENLVVTAAMSYAHEGVRVEGVREEVVAGPDVRVLEISATDVAGGLVADAHVCIGISEAMEEVDTSRDLRCFSISEDANAIEVGEGAAVSARVSSSVEEAFGEVDLNHRGTGADFAADILGTGLDGPIDATDPNTGTSPLTATENTTPILTYEGEISHVDSNVAASPEEQIPAAECNGEVADDCQAAAVANDTKTDDLSDSGDIADETGGAASQTEMSDQTELSHVVSMACRSLDLIIDDQAKACQRFRKRLQEEVADSFRRWKDSPPNAAFQEEHIGNAVLSGDSEKAGDLISEAVDLGLPVKRTCAIEVLAKLRREEDLEGVWQCLASALADEDRFLVDFWREQAESQYLRVPDEVLKASDAMKNEEEARLAKWEYESELSGKAAIALARQDHESLRNMVIDAMAIGADPSAASAALASLRAGTDGQSCENDQARFQKPTFTPGMTREFSDNDAYSYTADSGFTIGSTAASSSSSTQIPPRNTNQGGFTEKQAEAGEDGEVLTGVPDKLYVQSPTGQTHVFGMYELVEDEMANGMPLWRQLGGERWLYSDPRGMWTIGGAKARELNFSTPSGFVYLNLYHRGAMPDTIGEGKWFRHGEETGQWVQDEEISVRNEFICEERRPKRGRGGRRGGRGGDSGEQGRGKCAAPKAVKTKAKSRVGGVRSSRDLFFNLPRADHENSSSDHTTGQAKHENFASNSDRKPDQGQGQGQGQGQERNKGGPKRPHRHRKNAGLGEPLMSRSRALKLLGLSGLPVAPSAQDIRRAYKKAALAWHPDRRRNHGREEDAKRRFQALRDALDVLAV